MKVKELIEKLRELDSNLDVYYGVSDTWFWTADEVEVCDPDNFGVDVCLIYHQVIVMKVKELIEKLQEFDSDCQEMEIRYFNCTSEGESIFEVGIQYPAMYENFNDYILIS